MDLNNNLIDDITEISRGRTVINATTNYGRYAVSFGIRLFLQAYIIRTLGRNEYAIWPLVFTCIGFVGLIPIAVGSGTGRFLAHALGRKDLKEVEQITTSLFAALLGAAVVYTVAIVLLSVYFERIFDIPEGAEGIGPWAMLLVGLSGAIALPFGVFRGGLRAAQKFVILNVIAVVFLVARLILIILAFTLAVPSLIWIAGINLALAMAEDLTFYIVAKKMVPWQRIRWRSFNWAVLKKVNSFSLLVLVNSIAGLLYWRTDNIIINKLLEPSLLTGYAVVVSFVLYTSQLTTLGVTVLIPAATIMHAKNQITRMNRLIYRVNRTVIPASVCLLSFIMMFGQEILTLYVGPSYAKYAILLPILGTSAIISVTTNAPSLVPHAFGRMLTISIMAIVFATLNVILSLYFVLVLKWGLIGVAAGTALVTVPYRLIFWPWYTARLLGVSFAKFFRYTVVIPLSINVPFILTILAMKLMNFGKGWVELISVFAVGSLVQAVYMVMYGLEKTDRMKVRELIAKPLNSLDKVFKFNNR